MSSFVSVIKRRELAWAVAGVMLVTAIWVAHSSDVRAGVDPPVYGIGTVYVAVGTNFPDSLGAAAGAGAQGSPVIIVPTDPPIPPAIAAELERLDPLRLVIVGGTSVISPAMESALGALLPNATIDRLAGANRYETNALFSQAVFPVEGWASIPAAAFGAPEPHDDVVANSGAEAHNLDTGELVAGIQLPHGAEILELKAFIRDNTALGDITVTLRRVTLVAHEQVASTTSSGGGLTSISTTVINNELVDNENYSYFVVVEGADNESLKRIRSVMVRYQIVGL